MPGKTWPLVLFTLLAQMAAGMVLALAVLHLAGRAEATAGLDSVVPVSALLMLGVAALAGASHLGSPLGLHRSLANLRSSWLSREALAGLGFALMCALLAGLSRGPASWRSVTLLLAALAAVALVYAISRLYMLRTVPAWNSLATPLSFFATALVLGGVALLVAHVLLAATDRTDSFALSLRRAVPLAAALLVAQLLLLLRQGARDERVGRTLFHRIILVGCRFTLAGMGLVLLRVAAGTAASAPADSLVLVACGCLLASEVVGRVLFYGLYNRVGL